MAQWLRHALGKGAGAIPRRFESCLLRPLQYLVLDTDFCINLHNGWFGVKLGKYDKKG